MHLWLLCKYPSREFRAMESDVSHSNTQADKKIHYRYLGDAIPKDGQSI